MTADQTLADSIVAIDVLLELDEAMTQQAIALNARLRADYPLGYPLGTEQVPHVSLVQLYVRASDLPQVRVAVADALSNGNSLVGRQLTATGIRATAMGGGLDIVTLDVEHTPELLQLHERVVQAVTPFAAHGGTSAAFSTTTSLPAVASNSWIVGYVETFIPKQSGEHYYAHVTLGVAREAFCGQIAAEPFAPVPFTVAGIGVRHLGEYGTGQQEMGSFPLPSWNDGEPRQRILSFVRRVTDPASPDYVAPAFRVATFDNDGTLWCERPVYIQFEFALDRVKALAPQHPEWQTTEPFRAVLQNDLQAVAASGLKGLMDLAMATHAGTTTAEFDGIVREWFANAQDPHFKQPYTALAFQPMVELLAYLRANGFKTYIVSGGGIEFVRNVSEQLYGIPPEQVIGSSIKAKYEPRDGEPVLVRLPELDFYDDKDGKPIAIQKFIGRRPIAAFGNSDGDQQMLEWTAAGPGSRLMLLVDHTDAAREYDYRVSPMGRLETALVEARKRDWLVVDIKADWKRVFAFE